MADKQPSEGQRQASYAKDAELRQICDANAISQETFVQDSLPAELEIAFLTVSSLVETCRFAGNITQLSVVNIPLLRTIKGIDQCYNLERLWVCETGVVNLDGHLSKCKKLRELRLYSNEIAKFAPNDFTTLPALEVLEVHNNKLAKLQYLDKLVNLKRLNAAGNSIVELGSTLDKLSCLEELNLSGNNFFDACLMVEELTRVPSLKRLFVCDPDYATNPICASSGLFTMLRFKLPHLERIDHLRVDSEAAQNAVADAIGRKKIFGRMRDHISIRDYYRRCQTARSLHLKRLADARPAVAGGGAGGDEEEVLDEGLPDLVVQALQAEEKVLGLLRKLNQLELDSFGNLQYRQGSADTSWYTPCMEMVKGRFQESMFKSAGITGLRIINVVRVYNNASATDYKRFYDICASSSPAQPLSAEEMAAMAFGDNWGPVTPRNMIKSDRDKDASGTEDAGRPGTAPCLPHEDLMFYINPSAQGLTETEILHMIKHGFRPAGSDGTQPVGQGGAGTRARQPTSFSKHLHVAEAMLLKGGGKQPDAAGGTRRRTRLLMARVNLLECQKKGQSQEKGKKPATAGPRGSRRASTMVVPDVVTIANPSLALPELIVDVEYLTASDAAAATEGDATAAAPLAAATAAEAAEADDEDPPDLAFYQANANAGKEGETGLAKITSLSLGGKQLRALPQLNKLSALTTVVLRRNKITSLSWFEGMLCLEVLDVSHNAVASTMGLSNVPKLRLLDLRHNKLSLEQELLRLPVAAPALDTLDLRGNPLLASLYGKAKVFLCDRLKLAQLDGAQVANGLAAPSSPHPEAKAGETAEPTPKAGTAAQLLAGATAIKSPPLIANSDWISRCLLEMRNKSTAAADTDGGGGGGEAADLSLKTVTSINVTGLRLTTIPSLASSAQLTWLNLSKNRLLDVPGLNACANLEELNLHDNLLTEIPAIAECKKLRRLDVSFNHLVSLDKVQFLTQLEEINAAHNGITSLISVGKAVSLQQLHVNDNLIGSSWEVYHLRSLPKLEVLDLSGNVMQTRPDYRLFVIYHLDFLIALDGSVVEPDHVKAAWQKFDGKLSIDVLIDIKGIESLSKLQQLDIPSAGIRDVLYFEPQLQLLSALHSVNLQHNRLSSFGPLGDLPGLRVLCLDGNKIRRFESSKSPRPATAVVFPELRVLHLACNGICDLTALQLNRMKKLRSLFLQRNDIAITAGLSDVPMLEDLVLEANRIKAISDGTLSTCKSLKEVHLQSNRLRDLGEIPTMKRLERLYLHNNRVSALEEIKRLQLIPRLVDVSLNPNPICLTGGHSYRPMLVGLLHSIERIDGQNITEQDRYDAAELYGYDHQQGHDALAEADQQGTQHIGYAAEGGEDAADDNLPELRIGVMRGVTLPSIGPGSSTQRRAPKGSGNYRR